LAFHECQITAFSWAMPISATLPRPPAAAAASISGRATSSLLSPLAKRRTGMPLASANPRTSASYAWPIFLNAADDGMKNPRCQRRNRHTQPTD